MLSNGLQKLILALASEAVEAAFVFSVKSEMMFRFGAIFAMGDLGQPTILNGAGLIVSLSRPCPLDRERRHAHVRQCLEAGQLLLDVELDLDDALEKMQEHWSQQ